MGFRVCYLPLVSGLGSRVCCRLSDLQYVAGFYDVDAGAHHLILVLGRLGMAPNKQLKTKNGRP